DQKTDAQTNQLRQETNTGFAELRKEMNARFEAADQKIDAQTNQLRQEMNTKFHWTLGVVLASWISTIGTLLLK
ncbi:MAG: hypothetical protein OXN90_14745, partial [Gemmatimonadota bacterium]|nr:hypothetical protein [Gemmatimonadota bacterium]